MKKKIFGITLAVCILVLSIASTTIAYFTDTKEQTQVFTAGNVAITLTSSSNIFETQDDNQKMRLYPGQVLTSNSTIKNVGSEEAYVGAIITFSDKAVASNFNPNNLITGMFNWNEDVQVTYSADETSCKIYVVYPTELAVDTVDNTVDSSVELFDKITIPASWDHTEMARFNNLKITITAYATQTAGLESVGAAKALNAAFPTVWPAPTP